MATVTRALAVLWHTFVQKASALDLSLSPAKTLAKLRAHKLVLSDAIYVFHTLVAAFWLYLIPSLLLKLVIPIGFLTLLLIPLTSQFFLPATPILEWVLTWASSRYIPTEYRPAISVSLLPTLETVLYGANISDILTRFTHPILDIVAWIPYGVVHFGGPFVLSAFIWLFAPKGALRFWANAFGYMNFVGVVIQILLPCAAPWYEVIHGLTPANYSMKGSPGGLARIDALFGSTGYTVGFSNAPVVFGAFPSLHAACATIEALFVSHFFPQLRTVGWGYAGLLYWSTMYLTHHYLVDVVGGACLAIAFFYLFMPLELAAIAVPPQQPRSKYELYDIDVEEGPLARKDAFFRRPKSNTFSSTASSADEPLNSAAPLVGDADRDEGQPFSATSDPDEEGDMGAYREPTRAVPFLSRLTGGGGSRARGAYRKPTDAHKRTASIVSLIGPDERSADEGWGAWGIVPPRREPPAAV
ncbi:PAP2-domain-containing protein [Exidia glandulosa HHB12029]|uniref:PAP2-domain-containing protein n=1 Tax=Exidia glandulosa HHB12029 TaxID=1314781 RepID=A0A166BP95_EXIGL|nr:PAP2-domain-containing protein [Exidia glandulosa HHB12029]